MLKISKICFRKGGLVVWQVNEGNRKTKNAKKICLNLFDTLHQKLSDNRNIWNWLVFVALDSIFYEVLELTWNIYLKTLKLTINSKKHKVEGTDEFFGVAAYKLENSSTSSKSMESPTLLFVIKSICVSCIWSINPFITA